MENGCIFALAFAQKTGMLIKGVSARTLKRLKQG